MGLRVTQLRISALVGILAGIGMFPALASPPPTPSLERKAAQEFVLAGTALRERLNRETAGDSLGASIAAHDAQLHRYRYLDLKREINRLHPQAAASSSVAAPRDPFMPDDSFSAESAPVATRTASKAAEARAEVPSYRSWDMYRSRESNGAAGSGGSTSGQVMRATPAVTPIEQATDPYAADTVKSARHDQSVPAHEMPLRAPSGDTAQQPFLVYRERLARSDSRE
jgi:hypothetical protein